MGQILQIRVMAYTPSEDDITRKWPKLVTLVWPERILQTTPANTLINKKYGVLELVQDLHDWLQFAQADATQKHDIKKDIVQMHAAANALQQALADWNASQANQLTTAIEDSLDAAEKNIHWLKI